jgi:TPP-dependent indolepyruvate ferredoxin oxidoreductase alpha subunit
MPARLPSGVQALVRLAMQRRPDRATGMNTGGFISGYRGAPITTPRSNRRNTCSTKI